MSANVRCAGGGAWLRDHGRIFQVTDPNMLQIAETGSCFWKGERFPSVDMLDLARRISADAAFAERATAKPCPRCGGRVELILVVPDLDISHSADGPRG